MTLRLSIVPFPWSEPPFTLTQTETREGESPIHWNPFSKTDHQYG